MKPEHIRTIGSTIFWTFLIISFIHVVFLSALGPESIFNQTMRAVLGCFCFFGISLEMAADRIQKKIEKQAICGALNQKRGER